jgi:CubicO group peptidase (beta-lactamase class C family)
MLDLLMTRCRVPASLESVATARREREIPEREVGIAPGGVEEIWQAVERLYRSGMHPAIALCVRRRGQVVLDRSIGHVLGNGPEDPPDAEKILATPDTLFNVFSASKAVTAMVIHLLDQRRLLHLDDHVVEYFPEFGEHGKRWITIRHVLTHRAGVPNIPPEAMNLDNLERPERIAELLCDATPLWRPGRLLGYHAITGGFILGEVVRRVTGKDIRTVLGEEILQPLGFRWTSYGVRPEHVPLVAKNYYTGPPLLPPVSTLMERALGLPLRQIVALSNDRRFLTAIVPAGNVVTTANELSRFFQLLLAGGALGGVRIFEPRTIRRATSEQSYLEFDFTLGIPLRHAMGFMLGGEWLSLYGPGTEQAFGHVGFTNVLGWADPERQVSVGLMNSGKPIVYPQAYYLYEIARTIGRVCPKTSG